SPTSAHRVQLDPTLVAVSCERVKKVLLSELEARDRWRGRIYVDLHPARSPDEVITVTSFFRGGEWNYSMDLPSPLAASRLVSATVQVLLLEMADRNSTSSVEIPLWLAEGLTRQIIFSSDIDLVP